jgi:hypothetical protein
MPVSFSWEVSAAAVSPPAAASAMPSATSGMHEQAALSEASLPRIAAPRTPERPAQCFDRHRPCGPGAIPLVHAEPLVLGLTRRASIVTPRAPERVPVPDVAPHLAASLSILFRNFRK